RPHRLHRIGPDDGRRSRGAPRRPRRRAPARSRRDRVDQLPDAVHAEGGVLAVPPAAHRPGDRPGVVHVQLRDPGPAARRGRLPFPPPAPAAELGGREAHLALAPAPVRPARGAGRLRRRRPTRAASVSFAAGRSSAPRRCATASASPRAAARRVRWLETADVAARLRMLRTDQAAWRAPNDTGQFSRSGAPGEDRARPPPRALGRPGGRVPTTHIPKPPIRELDGPTRWPTWKAASDVCRRLFVRPPARRA